VKDAGMNGFLETMKIPEYVLNVKALIGINPKVNRCGYDYNT